MTMNISNCNFCYPKLNVSPSFGEAMRYHAEFRDGQPAINDVENYQVSFQRYISEGVMEVIVDWGNVDSSHHKVLVDYITKTVSNIQDDIQDLSKNPIVELTVHKIGCRPAMALLASSIGEVEIQRDIERCHFSEMSVSWSDFNNILKESIGNPEYLVTLRISHNKDIILARTLHVVPPPIGPLQYQLQDIIWAPKLFQTDEVNSKIAVQNSFDLYCRVRKVESGTIARRRRGFGLELETVRMPLTECDFEHGCFTQQQEFDASIERARKWHLSSANTDGGTTNIQSINAMWDQFLLWSVSHDLYVENAAPPSRVDLYEKLRAHIMKNRPELDNPENTDILQALDHLVLGGKPMPTELLRLTPYEDLPSSQASPEYKSPLPPNELFHEFPVPLDGKDQADASIRLFLDGILKNPNVSSKPVAVPLVSDIGQSATSIHVHVNVVNKEAWPREVLNQMSDVEQTNSLLCVIFAWICFDRVVQNNFCMPNVWRDRSFAPMLPSGPEFVWKDLAWEQGCSISSINNEGAVTDVSVYNIPAWFRHVHSSYTSYFCQDKENESSSSLFETVFDQETMINTISRWNSLNLLPINTYGTLEFRRMHASLNADFVSAWTWFCVGFVEKFSSPVMWNKFLHPFLNPTLSWKQNLELFVQAQNNATIEDLIDTLTDNHDQAVPPNVFQILMSNVPINQNDK